MPSLDLCVGWVVQVHPAKLAAHLQAYVDLLPTLDAFRLCHRFGNSPLSRLPIELAALVEDHLIAQQRETSMADLSGRLKCFEGTCNAIDHYSKAELEDIRDTIMFEGVPGAFLHHSNGIQPSKASEIRDEVVDDYMAYSDMWYEQHYEQREAFLDLIGHPQAPASGIFHKHLDVVRHHFGLQVWLSHYQRETPVQGGLNYEYEPTRAIEAHLILPANLSASEKWNSWAEHPDEENYGQYAFAYPFSAPQQQTEKSLERFSRAPKILGLEAVTDKNKSTTSVPCKTASKKVAPELKLMLRVVNEVRL